MPDSRKLENIQNLHVALWLAKDLSWCSLWRVAGLSLALPTMVVALLICWETRKSAPDLIHNLAVCIWISANITWMIGEFFFNDQTRRYAQVLFYSGVTLLGVYYLHHLLVLFWRSSRRSLTASDTLRSRE